MRTGSPNRFRTTHNPSSSDAQAKSLFWNILPVTPYGSRFCADSARYPLSKSFRMKILGNRRKKYVETSDRPGPEARPKSLFRKILPLSPFGSRFCPDKVRSNTGKSFRMRILEKQEKKKCGERRSTARSPSLRPHREPWDSSCARRRPLCRRWCRSGPGRDDTESVLSRRFP